MSTLEVFQFRWVRCFGLGVDVRLEAFPENVSKGSAAEPVFNQQGA